MEKSYTVIGGADGPTSIFLAGNFKGHKEKNIIKIIKRKILNTKVNIKPTHNRADHSIYKTTVSCKGSRLFLSIF